MNTAKTFVTRIFKDESGAGMVEYSLLVALVGVLLIGTIISLTGGIATAFNSATTAMGGLPVVPAPPPVPAG